MALQGWQGCLIMFKYTIGSQPDCLLELCVLLPQGHSSKYKADTCESHSRNYHQVAHGMSTGSATWRSNSGIN